MVGIPQKHIIIFSIININMGINFTFVTIISFHETLPATMYREEQPGKKTATLQFDKVHQKDHVG